MGERYYTIQWLDKNGQYHTEHFVPLSYPGFGEPPFIHRCENPSESANEYLLKLFRSGIENLKMESKPY